jgi:hypothetical protein
MKHAAGRQRVWALAGAACLALSVGVLARRAAERGPSEELRDAVASPVSAAPIALPRGAAPAPSYFSTPSSRRADAEEALLSSRRRRVDRAQAVRARRAARSVAAE